MSKTQKSVMIVDLSRYYGGADVRVLEVAQALQAQGRKYTVVVLAGSPLHERLDAAGLSVLTVPYRRSDPRTALFLRRAIIDGGYDVIDAHNPQSQFWAFLARRLCRNRRLIATIHSAYRLEHDGSLKGRLYEQVIRLNRWSNATFIAVSQAVYDYLISIGVKPARIELIENGISVPEQIPAQHPLYDDLSWTNEHDILVSVGRLEPVKGHRFLIAAVAALKSKRPNLRCMIIGDGRLKDDLQTQIEHLQVKNQVHLAGFRDDVPHLVGLADIFCMPSLSEGLPYALLEAMGLHVPVIVSRVGGMAELLTHETNGYLVPPEDVTELTAAIEWMLDNPDAAKRMASAAFELHQTRYSPRIMLEKTTALYDDTTT